MKEQKAVFKKWEEQRCKDCRMDGGRRENSNKRRKRRRRGGRIKQ